MAQPEWLKPLTFSLIELDDPVSKEPSLEKATAMETANYVYFRSSQSVLCCSVYPHGERYYKLVSHKGTFIAPRAECSLYRLSAAALEIMLKLTSKQKRAY